ncbi:MAG: queuosine precursor transporter [Pseudomonadota bacterium]
MDRTYVLLCTLFSVLIVTGNLVYQKFVAIDILSIHVFELSVGAIFYPVTFLLTDLISEFYGSKLAAFCVKLSICMNVIVVMALYFMASLDATAWSNIDNATFQKIFGMYGVNFVGSIIACYVSQNIDIKLYLFIRKITNSKHLWLRNNVSTAISLLIDTVIIISFLVAFKVLPSNQMLPLIINSYLFKLFFTICSTPIFYLGFYGIRYIRRRDNIS